MNELHTKGTAKHQRHCTECLRVAATGRQQHARGEVLARHRHVHAFAAVVLCGSYVEAGDSGLHRVHAGHVLFHCMHERHLDRMHANGAEVLVLPLPDDWSGTPHAQVSDADAIAQLAERDVPAAVACLLGDARPMPQPPGDWPQQLAAAMLADPNLSLTQWARSHNLHPGSVSRGFQQVFAVSPKAFRLQARTHAALKLYRASSLPAAAIAHMCGFADQAHFSRSVTALTGATASRLRWHPR
ncbi:helix-turn-helix transcriptional regulator [Dyella sp. Tek66A03]|uniref:helix-turn-helix transcriptional regulator n=1 Tax=Dyella sp. Tek66A03 TaxID=3458298 RepID=UPI00403E92B1